MKSAKYKTTTSSCSSNSNRPSPNSNRPFRSSKSTRYCL